MRMITVLVLCVVVIASALMTHAQDAASEIEAVRRVVEGANAAVNAGKLDEVLAFYADDAKIDSKAAGRLVSKDEYREAMKTLLERRALNRADVTNLIPKLIDPTHATVDGTVYIISLLEIAREAEISGSLRSARAVGSLSRRSTSRQPPANPIIAEPIVWRPWTATQRAAWEALGSVSV